MRLTNKHRCAFVAAVMADVPSVDYTEKVKALVNAALFKAAPATVKKLYKEDPSWLAPRGASTPAGHVYTPLVPPDFKREKFLPMLAQCKVLAEKLKAQEEERTTLQRKVWAMIRGCTTLKQAQERLPEFAKYLPQPPDSGTPNLPTTTDVLDSLTKAGWPKGGA